MLNKVLRQNLLFSRQAVFFASTGSKFFSTASLAIDEVPEATIVTEESAKEDQSFN